MASFGMGSAQSPARLPALPLRPCLHVCLPTPWLPVCLLAVTPRAPVLASPVTAQDCDRKGSVPLPA